MNYDRFFKFGITFFLVVVLWGYLFTVSIHAVLPDNPIKLPLEQQLKVPTWFPQGWGFYSKDPRDTYFNVVNIEEEKLAANWPNNIPENLFGLKRLGRSQGIEAGLLHSMVLESSKKACKENPYSCLDEFQNPIVLKNPSPNPTLCGDIGFFGQEPIPWAWSGSNRKIEMPSKVVRVNVSCSKE